MADFSSYLDSASKYLSDAWNGTDPSQQKPVVQIPSKPENTVVTKPNEDESWYSDYVNDAEKLVSDASTSLQNKAKYFDDTYLTPATKWTEEKSDEAVAYYEKKKTELTKSVDSVLVSAKQLYNEHEDEIIATVLSGPLGGLAVYGAKQLLEEPTKDSEQPIENVTPSDSKTNPKELILSEATDPVNEASDTTHARTVASNDTINETTYRSEPEFAEAAPSTNAKTTVTSTASSQRQTALNIPASSSPVVDKPQPAIVAQAIAETAVQTARTTTPILAETKVTTNEVAVNTQSSTATVTSAPVVVTTETQQTSDGDSGSPDSDNGNTIYTSASSGEGSNASTNGLAGLVSDPLGLTDQYADTTSQSASGNNTTTNSELASASASSKPNESYKPNQTSNRTVNADTQNAHTTTLVAASPKRTDQEQKGSGINLSRNGSPMTGQANNTTPAASSNGVANNPSAIAAGAQHSTIANDLRAPLKDTASQGKVATAYTQKLNGTGDKLDSNAGDSQNPDGNQAETVAAVTDFENYFQGENEDYPVDHTAIMGTITNSASQISTFG